MKTVMASTKYDDTEYPYTMLENLDDLVEYAEYLESGEEKVINRVFSSKAPAERWDHLVDKSDEGGLLLAGYTLAKLRGTNPLMEMGGFRIDKIMSMESMILNGDTILVNEVGGYCPYSEDYHRLGSLEIDKQMIPINIAINENTKYINLENDEELEQHTIYYLERVDPNYSYICSLRDWEYDDLVKLLVQFEDCGGEVVYVYTTGTDVPQMYEYSKAIIESGLRKVEFEFNAGYTMAFDDVIITLQNAGVEVKVIGLDESLKIDGVI